MNLQEMAINDFALFKQNKISEVIIANKLENDSSYKETMISLFKNDGDELVKNGQSIPDVNSYALQKINNIIDDAKKIPISEKIDLIKEYEHENKIPAEYVVKTFENNTVITKNVNTLFIEDILSIESENNLLSVERIDLDYNLSPFLAENGHVIFAQSIAYVPEGSIPLNQNETIEYYKYMINEKNIEFNEFSKKMSSFLDIQNKDNQIRFENAYYLTNQLDRDSEKFNQFSISFIKNAIDENEPNRNIKVDENIKGALKNTTNPIDVFVETVKKKILKETKLLIYIVDDTKKKVLQTQLKNINDKLFNRAINDAEKKLEHQQINQKSNQFEKNKNAQILL